MRPIRLPASVAIAMVILLTGQAAAAASPADERSPAPPGPVAVPSARAPVTQGSEELQRMASIPMRPLVKREEAPRRVTVYNVGV
jgi:hypothetical protein